MKKVEIDIEKYIELLETGKINMADISREEGVARGVIRYRINEYYEKTKRTRPNFRAGIKKSQIDIEKYIELLESSQITIKDIAREECVSIPTIRKLIDEYYEKNKRTRPNFRAGIKKSQIDIEKYIELLESRKISIVDIAREECVSIPTIRKLIDEYYKTVKKTRPNFRNGKTNGKRILLDIEKYVDDYIESRITLIQIAEIENVSYKTVVLRMEEYFQNHNFTKKRNCKYEKYIEALEAKKITVTEIARLENISVSAASKGIDRAYEFLGRKKPEKSFFSKSQLEKYIKALESGEITFSQIAQQENVSSNIVRNSIYNYYARLRKEVPKVKRKFVTRKAISIEQYIEDWENGMIMSIEIAKKEGVSPTTIKKRINEYYTHTEKEKPDRKQRNKRKERIERFLLVLERGGITKEELERMEKVYGLQICKYIGWGDTTEENQGIEDVKSEKKDSIEPVSEPEKFEIKDFIVDYEKGIINVYQIAIKLKMDINRVKKEINKYYTSQDRIAPKYKKVSKALIKVLQDYLSKGLTNDEIREIALSRNTIIPESAFDIAREELENQNKKI